MLKNIMLFSTASVTLLFHSALLADEISPLDACLLHQVKRAQAEKTLQAVRDYCEKELALYQPKQLTEKTETALEEQQPPLDEIQNKESVSEAIQAETETLVRSVEKKSAIVERQMDEEIVEDIPFSIVPHRPNYVLVSHNFEDPNEEPFEATYPDRDYDFEQSEIKYQLSFKSALAKKVIFDRGDLYFGFTLRSFWQAFNHNNSSPFRENNYEPEMWLSFNNDWSFFGVTNRMIRLGASHQSNGQAGPLSRSWNRLYVDFIFEKGNYYTSFKPWWRIKEREETDDNPDIDDYMGYFEWLNVYKYDDHTFSLLLRNNLRSDNKGAVQVDWSFPINDHLRGYLQWFNGYGESLIDYNERVNTIGVGVQLTDWL